MSFARSMPRVVRIVVMFLALVAMMGVATAAESPDHLHAKAPAGTCDICFSAHVVAYEAASGLVIPTAPATQETVLAPFETIAGYKLLFPQTSLSRGPPLAL